MATKCRICGKVAKQDDIFFDVSSSETGLDIIREDDYVCILDIIEYISTTTLEKINLIRRIDNPCLGR